MKTVFNYLITFILFVFSCHSLFSQCVDGGLEQNDTTSWNTWFGAFNTTPENMTQGISVQPPPNFNSVQIVNSGFDPNVSILNRVLNGNNALRIGNLGANDPINVNSSMASYTFTVDASNENFRFWYAMVANSSPHASDDELNRMTWYMKLGPGTTANAAIPVNTSDPSWNLYQLTAFQRVIPQDPTTDPWFTQFNNSPIWYRSWTCQNYDLSAWRGQQITIYFRTYDCLPGGDLLYMYVDGLCSPQSLNVSFDLPTTACRTPETPLILDATATQNADSYTLSIVEDLPPGTPFQTIFSTLYTGTFFTQPPGIVDIRELYRTQTGITRFQCGKRYKVRLTATNSCGENGSVEKIIRITCPPVNAGSDKVVCCGQNVTIGLNLGGYIWPYPSFSWSPVPAGVEGNTAQMTFTPTQSGIYTLTTTDNNGCTNSDRVNVKLIRDFEVNVSENCPQGSNLDERIRSCEGYYTLTANVNELTCPKVNGETTGQQPIYDDYSFEWHYNGFTHYGRTIQTPPYVNGQDSIKLIVSNSCFSKTINYRFNCPKFVGLFPVLTFPSAFSPLNATNPQNLIFYIKHYFNGQTNGNWWDGAPNAYNAYGFHLRVYDRWGGLVYNKKVLDYSGLEQSEISWNGKYNGTGNVLPQGVYNFTLDLFNCSFPDGYRVQTTLSYHCVSEIWFFGMICSESYFHTWTNPSGIFYVNLLH
ncbi:MAG: gliding motility-associated C-terminal domain-containing protein [Flavobacteriales bacterium]|nr:gliding motility-associated C-terminal domain-containing protein [Flavobacteriales bacterium]